MGLPLKLAQNKDEDLKENWWEGLQILYWD